MGRGLGGAVIKGRKIEDSSEEVRPEGLGHFPLEPRGLLCSCGKRGCWEAQASLTGLKKRFEAGAPPEEAAWDAKEIFDRAEAGHARAAKAVESFFSDLARGLSVLNSRFHPEELSLGGAASER